jgi:hypothetical protein
VRSLMNDPHHASATGARDNHPNSLVVVAISAVMLHLTTPFLDRKTKIF